MKKRVLVGMTALLLSISLLMAQEIPAGVITAFKRGSSQELSKNKVSGFNVNHQGKRDESSFIIGTLATTRGNFRVNCFLKKVENQYLIHQIRIDKINE